MSYSWRTSATLAGNSLSSSYDALSRNLTQVGPQGTVSSQWDVAGRRTRLAWPDGFFVDYEYLVTGEMTKIRENGATSGAGMLATFAYDDLGRTASLNRGNGALTTYAYDPVSRLQTLTDKPSSASYDQVISFTYNPTSQIVARTASNDTYAWTGHGNGSTASIADGLNRLTSIGGTASQHDSRGNVTFDPTTGKSYTYSSENLLMTASGGVALTYDSAMRLHQVIGGPTTRFAYDGLDMIAEYDGAGTMLARYIYGPGMDQPLIRYDGSGTSNKVSLHSDERGSITALSYGSPYAPTINRYDEYGKPQPSNVGRFQYTGQIWLGELSAYYYKARIYSPTFGGRFLQTDPIGYEGGTNLYAYVGNNPVNITDPMGLEGDLIGDRTVEEVVRLDYPVANAFGERSYDWMGIMGRPAGGLLESAAYGQTQRDLAWASARLTQMSIETGIGAGCLLSPACTNFVVAAARDAQGRLTIGSGRVTSGILVAGQRFDVPSGEGTIYITTETNAAVTPGASPTPHRPALRAFLPLGSIVIGFGPQGSARYHSSVFAPVSVFRPITSSYNIPSGTRVIWVMPYVNTPNPTYFTLQTSR